MKIDWTLYDPGLEDGSISVNDVVREEDCTPGAVYNHCRQERIRLKGKRKPFKRKGSYLDELNDGVMRYGSKRAVVRHFREFGWY